MLAQARSCILWAMGVFPRALSLALHLALPLSALACATGGGSSGTRRDTGANDGSVRDTGSRDTGVRDSGAADTAPACVDDAIPDDCEMADELGTLDVGGAFSVDGKLPTLVDEDWYAFDVPPGYPAAADAGVDAGVDGGPPPVPMAGSGTPHIELVSSDATMVMEVRTRCGAALSCGDSTARELLQWSFTDDQSLEGAGAYSTRDVPWPERVYVKISRRGGPASCEDYLLRVTR